jgi:hypothetical protein
MSFRFFPTLETKGELVDDIGYDSKSDFQFFRVTGLKESPITITGNVITDTFWDQERDSLKFYRNITIRAPKKLYGKDGIACLGAELGLCVLWADSVTSMSGCVKPREEYRDDERNKWSVSFVHTFAPGEVRGILELKVILYLKTSAKEVLEGERILNNTSGVIVGEFESYRIKVSSDELIPFPLVQKEVDSKELWWVEFYNWEDPNDDGLFGASSFVVVLNQKCTACPKVNTSGNDISNLDLFLEILTNVYVQLYKKLTESQFSEMKNGRDLKPGTISSELNRMYDLCGDKFEFESSYEQIHRAIQKTIRDKGFSVENTDEEEM